jgi:excinuclease UvrABC nuclease subunit
MSNVPWPLGNGQTLEFTVYDPNITKWYAKPGLYIFASVVQGYWKPLYIGQADSFADRIPSHERYAEAAKRGATHIHATVVEQEANRDRWERMLIEAHQPPMNDQYRGATYLSSLLSNRS